MIAQLSDVGIGWGTWMEKVPDLERAVCCVKIDVTDGGGHCSVADVYEYARRHRVDLEPVSKVTLP